MNKLDEYLSFVTGGPTNRRIYNDEYLAEKEAKRQKRWWNARRSTRRHVGGVVGHADVPDVGYEPIGDEEQVPNITDANLVGSKVQGKETHLPVLDIDVPAMLVPSSTPGHHHLYVNIEIPWEKYERLLDMLVEVGWIEPNYAEVCKLREATFVRTPWTRKETLPEMEARLTTERKKP